ICMPLRLMERIWPLGRKLAVPPPLRDTCLPGSGRLVLRLMVPLFPVPVLPVPVGPLPFPFLPTVPVPVVLPVPRVPVVPGPVLPTVPVFPTVVPVLVPVVPGLPFIGKEWVVAGRDVEVFGALTCGVVAAFGVEGVVVLC